MGEQIWERQTNAEHQLLRVLYFHHASNPGGAPRSLALLIGKLVSRGVEAIVAMPDRTGNEFVASLFTQAGARVIQERDIRPFHGSTVAPNRLLQEKLYALYGYWPLARCSRRLVTELKPDIVHLNSTALVAAAHGSHLGQPGVPVIAHVREPLLDNHWGGLLRRLNRHHVDHFISIDETGDKSVSASAKSRDIVRNSAGDAFFRLTEDDRTHARAALGWDDDRLTLLSLSRLTPSNGACELAEAIKRVECYLPRPVRVVFAGFAQHSGSAYETAARVAIAEAKSCVAMPFINDVLQAIVACDAIVAPFLTNHSARSVFEGAAAARPALVSRVPNLTELITEGQTGVTYTPGNDNELVSAIERLCDDEIRTAMGEAARALAQERFSETQNADAVLAIYAKLLDRSKSE